VFVTARLENAVLQERVKKLTDRVKLLAVENETLKAEVEIYREQAAVPTFSKLALGNSAYTDDGMDVDNANSESDAFVRAGNGIYPNQNQVTLEKLHEMANPLCCALSPDDTVLATGGADATVRLSQWGAAFDTNTTPVAVAQVACRLQCAAPVICVAFSPLLRGVAAAGCMDGSLHILNYKTVTGAGIQASGETLDDSMKHRKFVRGVAWSDRKPILATAGADGTVQVFRAERTGMDFEQVTLSKLESFHLQGAVESLCFVQDKLVCYARGFPHLSLFDMSTYLHRILSNDW
jgi:WD40 repeat protein